MLKLGAVDFHDRVWVAVENFRSRLDDARFSRTGWSEKQHRPDGPVWGIHPGEKDLIKAAHATHRTFLTHDARRKSLLEILSAGALLIGIQENCSCRVHVSCFRHFDLS